METLDVTIGEIDGTIAFESTGNPDNKLLEKEQEI